jgi:CMP-N-acetylneuraminic acid synthetase
MMRLDEGRLKPFIDDIDIMGNYYSRQLLPSVYRLNGVVDVSWCKQVLESGNLYVGDMRGYVMPAERSIDIDNEFDMSLVELLLSGEHYGKASKNP